MQKQAPVDLGSRWAVAMAAPRHRRRPHRRRLLCCQFKRVDFLFGDDHSALEQLLTLMLPKLNHHTTTIRQSQEP